MGRRVFLRGVVDGAAGLVEGLADPLPDRLDGAVAGPTNGRGPATDGPCAEPGQGAEQPRALLALELGPALLVGDEVDLGGPVAEQPSRVDVGLAGPGAEVECLPRRPHHLALADLVTSVDRDGAEVGVARPDAVGVEDDDVVLAGDGPGKDDLAIGGGHHRRTRASGVLDAPVSGVPVLRRRPEGVDHGGVDRGPIGDSGRRRPGRQRGHDRDERDEGSQHDGQPAHVDPQGQVNRWGEVADRDSLRSEATCRTAGKLPQGVKKRQRLKTVSTPALAGGRPASTAAAARPWCGFGRSCSR